MVKRRSLIVTVTFVLVFLFTLISNITIFDRTLTAYAADAPSYVTVNGQKLYGGYYLESNDCTSYSIGATAEPVQYVAWYKDGILILNNYNGDQISTGSDLIIKLKGTNTIESSWVGISASDCESIVIGADSEAATLNINVSSAEKWVFGICAGFS